MPLMFDIVNAVREAKARAHGRKNPLAPIRRSYV